MGVFVCLFVQVCLSLNPVSFVKAETGSPWVFHCPVLGGCLPPAPPLLHFPAALALSALLWDVFIDYYGETSVLSD